ncbi:MAG: DUF1573 domain-containing protein [Bacteroidales bacterium]|nr:DUF1573 domain-containing protein [Bacteroidales bacterium]MBR6132279.1 DUF1573 domain-containing protein [Bacteroidales bacterium]
MKKIMILSLILCLFGATQAQTSKSSTGKSSSKSTYTGTGAEIEFDRSYVNFGTLKVKDVKVVTVTFTNIGKKPLILDDVISSCDCTEVEWSKAPVMPGKKGTIKLTYTAKDKGIISKRLTVLSNANTDRVILQMKGEVQ